jgi:transposase
MAIFQTVDRETPYLMPPSIQEWLPKNHMARFIVEVVDKLDLNPLYDSYSGRGSEAANPGMLLTLIFYGYSTGIFSSRKLEKATYESIPVRYICGNTHPDHDTIANFRKRFLPYIRTYFKEILLIARELEFLKLGNISIDGSKIKANASKHGAMSYGHAAELEKALQEEIRQLFELAEKTDAEEKTELDIPKEIELREKRLEKIVEAKQAIEERAAQRDEANKAEHEERIKRRKEKEEATGKKLGGKEPKPPETGPQDKDQYNFTDPESAIMKSGSTGAFEQDYNVQVAVDQKSFLVVGNHLSNHPNDSRELLPVIDSIPKEVGKPDAVAADTGYFSENNINECVKRCVEPFIAAGREAHYYSVEQLLEQETSLADINVEGLTPAEAMRLKLKTREGKEVYRLRKCTAEPVFGIIKEILGFRQFLLRGIENVAGEWCLVCSAFNLKRMFNMRQKKAACGWTC